MNVCKLGLSIAMLLSGGMAFAQGTVDDYNRAYALREKFSANKVFYSSVTPQWIEGTHQFWYVRNTPEGRIYVSVNADKKNRKELFDHKRLASALSNASGKEVKPEAIQLERLRVNPSLDTLRFVFGNQRWMYATRKNQLVNEGALPDRNAPQKHWMERDDEKEAAPVTSPDGKYTAYIKNQNVYVKELATGKEKQYEIVGNLSKTANGNLSGSAKLDFETYTQRQYFRQIIRAANKRLVRMTSGEFILQCRDVEKLGSQGQAGLDLDVYHMATDTVRDVKTLSGGESFMAALSMALGLSDIVQNTAGAIHLDTMFIDEGFGSLDDVSRDQAIRVLNDLADKDRLIGIISHVNELKEQIDHKLVVKKNEKGSSVSWSL